MTAAAAALAGELAFHRRMARPGLFVDVGAHVGAFSFAMAELPGVEVLAFEPLPHAYATLAERAAAKPGVRALPLGLSDREGLATLTVPHLRDGPVWEWASMAKDFEALRSVHSEITQLSHFDITLTRLDTLRLRDVRAMKLDAEGAEYEVLRGARDLLKHQRPFLTVELEERHCLGCTWSVPAFLDALGYTALFELEGEMHSIALFDRARMQQGGASPGDRGYSVPYVSWFVFVPDEHCYA